MPRLAHHPGASQRLRCRRVFIRGALAGAAHRFEFERVEPGEYSQATLPGAAQVRLEKIFALQAMQGASPLVCGLRVVAGE